MAENNNNLPVGTGLGLLKEGWFSETSTLWPGQAMSLEVDEVLWKQRSDYQDVVVFKSKTYGNVLVLDGVIQATERDEFSYQEMLTHIPMCAHPNPESVLLIGGGDGGILREIEKHSCVKKIVQCEIDKMVFDVSKKFLPKMAEGFGDPRLIHHWGDGCAFVKEHPGEFDVIIVDSSDPIGPAATLFEREFYVAMKNALKPGGIVATQGECLWLHLDIIKGLIRDGRKTFKHAQYAFTTIPTYPSGQIGFFLGSLGEPVDTPVRKMDSKKDDLRYYNENVHRAAFVLPEFARRALEEDLEKEN